MNFSVFVGAAEILGERKKQFWVLSLFFFFFFDDHSETESSAVFLEFEISAPSCRAGKGWRKSWEDGEKGTQVMSSLSASPDLQESC